MSEGSRKPPPFDRDAPQIEYQDVPAHYASLDIPHVLARIRAFDRFFDEVVDAHFKDVYFDLYDAQLATLEKELRPYALELALSLIALENSLSERRARPPSVEASPMRISAVDVVTAEQGWTFADECFEEALESYDAFAAAKIMEWPDEVTLQGDDYTSSKTRFLEAHVRCGWLLHSRRCKLFDVRESRFDLVGERNEIPLGGRRCRAGFM